MAIGGGLCVVSSAAVPGFRFLSFCVVGGARPPLPASPHSDPGTSEAGDPHILANYMPWPSDCRRSPGVSPPAARYRFAGGAMLPQPQGAPARLRAWQNTATPRDADVAARGATRWFQLPLTRTA